VTDDIDLEPGGAAIVLMDPLLPGLANPVVDVLDGGSEDPVAEDCSR
jgi:hypothetical protein